MKKEQRLHDNFRAMLQLAIPVVIAELGWITMHVVDTIMVGRLGAEALGAVGVSTHLFFAAAIFGMGVLLGLDRLVSVAYGAGDLEACERWLYQGIYLALLMVPPLGLIVWGMSTQFGAWGISPEVIHLAVPYMRTLIWSLCPLLLYACFRRYLQAVSVVKPVMVALISANVLNVFVNWLLIFGNLGFSELGVVGAGWATFFSRVYMAGFLLVAILLRSRRRGAPIWRKFFVPERDKLSRLMRLGLPAASQVTLEVGVFALAAAFAALLNPVSLAAHQVAISVAAFTFMVPYGVSSAGAVRVGQSLGARNAREAEHSGWAAIKLGLAFMSVATAAFLLIPVPILSLFTSDVRVIRLGVSLLAVAAIFQLFDGLQVIATGILRGLGDTKGPMLVNLLGHWLLGLPVGYALCFKMGWGVTGLWLGLSLGLMTVGIVLLYVWKSRIRLIVQSVSLQHRSTADSA
ncbi:MAG: MATE family efflux transporter [Acidobacteriota bacterium]